MIRWGQHCVIRTAQKAERWVWGHEAPSSFLMGKESRKNQNYIKCHFKNHFHDFGDFILSLTVAIRRLKSGHLPLLTYPAHTRPLRLWKGTFLAISFSIYSSVDCKEEKTRCIKTRHLRSFMRKEGSWSFVFFSLSTPPRNVFLQLLS